MSSGAIVVIILAVVVIAAIAVIVAMSGRTKEIPEQAEPEARSGPGVETSLSGRAKVADFHVHGDEARVTFDIPEVAGDNEVIAALLSDQAVEVVREKRHSLPIDDVEQVVVFTGGDSAVELTRVRLNKPGELPDPGTHIDVLDFASVATDPLTKDFATAETTASATPTDDSLGPLSSELSIPAGVRSGLQAQGVDLATMRASDLVTGLLALTGYQIGPGPIPGTLFATRPGSRTFIAFDEYEQGDYHELDEGTIQRFAVDSQSSNADRSLLVTEKYAPFSIYQLEKRRDDIRILSRERLQAFVDATTLT